MIRPKKSKRRAGKGSFLFARVTDDLKQEWDAMLDLRQEEGAELLRFLVRREVENWRARQGAPSCASKSSP